MKELNQGWPDFSILEVFGGKMTDFSENSGVYCETGVPTVSDSRGGGFGGVLQNFSRGGGGLGRG